MSIYQYLRGLGLAASLAVLTAGSAGAAVLSEADVPGGAFGSWNAPTEVGAGITTVTGTGQGSRFDHLLFTALPAGKQTISLSFSAPEGIGYSYSAGGEIKFGLEPLKYDWDGISLGILDLNHGRPAQVLELALGEDFGGLLHFALYFTHGADLAYTISAPSNAPAVSPAPVPVPAGFLLIGSALGAIGLVRARSRRRSA